MVINRLLFVVVPSCVEKNQNVKNNCKKIWAIFPLKISAYHSERTSHMLQNFLARDTPAKAKNFIKGVVPTWLYTFLIFFRREFSRPERNVIFQAVVFFLPSSKKTHTWSLQKIVLLFMVFKWLLHYSLLHY